MGTNMTVHGTELHNDFPLTFSHSHCVCSLDTLSVSDDFTCTGPFNTNSVIWSPSTFYHSSSSSQSSLLELLGPCAPTSLFCVFSFQLLPYPLIYSTHVPSCLLLPHSSLSKEDICLLICPLLEWSSLDIFSTMWLLTLIGFPLCHFFLPDTLAHICLFFYIQFCLLCEGRYADFQTLPQ